MITWLDVKRNVSDCLKCGDNCGHTTLMHWAHPENYGPISVQEVLNLLREEPDGKA